MRAKRVCRIVEKETAEIYNTLLRLGITAKYRGFFYASYAISIAAKQPERLLMVTKWLYPDVAKRFDTTWICVERNIRTVADVAWKTNRPYLEEMAHIPLTKKPTSTEFLGILVSYISSNAAA